MAQTRAPRIISTVTFEGKIDSMRTNFGVNKELPLTYELASLVALSYYPELAETKIKFVAKKLNSTMAARPSGLNFIRRKGKRQYKVLLNNVNPQVPLDSASFNAQVGVIGHEFGHIVDYQSKSVIKLMFNAFGYASKKYRAKFERATDQRTIDHGLFWQCYDFSVYVFTHKKADAAYLEYKRKIYMSPEEIIEQK
ncbi:MAG: hypothetical protein ACI9J3_002480 [Parvicellaceae bacterium]|jgi:hypothetical protein